MYLSAFLLSDAIISQKSTPNQPLFLSVFVGTSMYKVPTCKQLVPPHIHTQGNHFETEF